MSVSSSLQLQADRPVSLSDKLSREHSLADRRRGPPLLKITSNKPYRQTFIIQLQYV